MASAQLGAGEALTPEFLLDLHPPVFQFAAGNNIVVDLGGDLLHHLHVRRDG